MKYLRLFETDADYQSFIGGGGTDYIEPHIALLRGSKTCHYKKYFLNLKKVYTISMDFFLFGTIY